MVHHYGDLVRARREMLGLSQRALANAAGVTQPMISAIEAGSRAPTRQVRDTIDAALVITPSVALRRRREKIARVIARHGGISAMVTGSVARGTDTAASDLDLLVEFEPDRDIVDLLALEEELTELLTIPVDVISAGSDGRVVENARQEAVRL